MAEVIGQNADGSYIVRRDDGVEVATATLPPSLQAPAAAPAPAPAPVAQPTRSAVFRSAPAEFAFGRPPVGLPAPPAPVRVEADPASRPPESMQSIPASMPENTPDPSVPVMPSPLPPKPPASVMGMRIGGASLYAMPSGTGGDNLGTSAAPTAPSSSAAAEPRKLTVDDFAITQPAAQPAAGTSTTSATIRTRSAGAPSSDAWKKYKEGADKVQSAAATEAAVAERQASVTLAQQRAEEADLKQRVEEDKLRMAEEQDAMRQSEADMRDVVKEASTPSGQIDPGRWWSSRTTGQKVAAGVSAFLAGFSGTTSPMVTAIEQDIAAQRDMLDRKDVAKRNAVEGQKMLHGMLVDRLKDSRLAYSAHKLLGLEHLRKTFESQMAETGVPLAKVRGEKAVGELMQAEGVAKAEFQQRAASLRAANVEASLKMAQIDALRAKTDAAGKDVPKALRERLVATPYGTIPALDAEAAKKLREKSEGYSNLMGNLNRLIALREKHGPEVMSAAGAEMQSLSEELKLRLKDAYNLGVMSDSDAKLLEQITGGDASSMKNPRTLDRLTALRERSTTSYNTAVKTYTGQSVGLKTRPADTSRGGD